jgi:hypothetical protein
LLLSAAAGCAGRLGFFERAYVDDRRPDLIDQVGEVRQRSGLRQSRLRRQDGSTQAQCHQGVQGQSAQGDSIQWKHHELSEKKQEKEKRILTKWGRRRMASSERLDFVPQDPPL